MSSPDEADRHTLPEQRSFCARQIRSIRARARSTEDPSERERMVREVETLKRTREKTAAAS